MNQPKATQPATFPKRSHTPNPWLRSKSKWMAMKSIFAHPFLPCSPEPGWKAPCSPEAGRKAARNSAIASRLSLRAWSRPETLPHSTIQSTVEAVRFHAHSKLSYRSLSPKTNLPNSTSPLAHHLVCVGMLPIFFLFFYYPCFFLCYFTSSHQELRALVRRETLTSPAIKFGS